MFYISRPLTPCPLLDAYSATWVMPSVVQHVPIVVYLRSSRENKFGCPIISLNQIYDEVLLRDTCTYPSHGAPQNPCSHSVLAIPQLITMQEV